MSEDRFFNAIFEAVVCSTVPYLRRDIPGLRESAYTQYKKVLEETIRESAKCSLPMATG